eukprot:364487-Chlamydomonas_euryale.AAC.16
MCGRSLAICQAGVLTSVCGVVQHQSRPAAGVCCPQGSVPPGKPDLGPFDSAAPPTNSTARVLQARGGHEA